MNFLLSHPAVFSVSHDLEGGEDLVLLVDHDHLSLAVHIWGHDLAVVARRNIASIPPDVLSTHKNTTKQQIMSINLRDIRELRKVDAIAVSKSGAL